MFSNVLFEFPEVLFEHSRCLIRCSRNSFIVWLTFQFSWWLFVSAFRWETYFSRQARNESVDLQRKTRCTMLSLSEEWAEDNKSIRKTTAAVKWEGGRAKKNCRPEKQKRKATKNIEKSIVELWGILGGAKALVFSRGESRIVSPMVPTSSPSISTPGASFPGVPASSGCLWAAKLDFHQRRIPGST